MFKMAKKKIKAEEIKVNESAEIIEIIEPANVVEEAIVESESDFPEQKTIPQLILDYINSQEGEYVELNDYLISLYSVPESISASKDIKYCLDKMAKNKQITLSNSRYHELGMTYYDDENKPKKHSILDLKILAKK